jgi:hypothetical protein
MFREISTRFRSTLAFAMVLWCAGTGCLMMSYARGQDRVEGSNSAREARNWETIEAAAGSHACCKARRSSSRQNGNTAREFGPEISAFAGIVLTKLPAPAGAASCCPLTSGSFLTSAHAQLNDSNLLTRSSNLGFLRPLANSRSTLSDHTIHLSILNRTYLRDCVFLI